MSATENRCIISVEVVGLFDWVYDELAVIDLDHRSTLSISFTSFNILVELCPSPTFVS
jgi:hypothetical protein